MELPVAAYNPRILQAPFGPAVNLRDLHAALAVGKDFSNWAKDRLKKYGFVEGEDYQVCSPNLASKVRGGHNALDYLVTLDTAKELAMVERNERGRAIRRYFIAVEKRARVDHLYAVKEVILRPDGPWGRVWAIPVYMVDGAEYWNVPLFLEAFFGSKVTIDRAALDGRAVNLMQMHPDLAGAEPLWVSREEHLDAILKDAAGCWDAATKRFVEQARAASRAVLTA
ncbi:MAG: antA/AntB antirepressor family protein [Rhodospirillaceae bacterium]